MHDTSTVDAPRSVPVRKIPIVPTAGLPVVAVLIGFVVYAIASNKFGPLMLCLVAGDAWLGSHAPHRPPLALPAMWLIVAAGMIEFAFVRNHTRGAPLAVVTGMLVVFGLDVPFLIATTVAPYEDRSIIERDG